MKAVFKVKTTWKRERKNLDTAKVRIPVLISSGKMRDLKARL